MQNSFLSDYNIKETIGKGTFSIVKLGVNKETNEKVAIKILKKKKIVQKADKSRLEREISILKKLNHINVIKSQIINEDSENYYIVMEYCENGELFNYIVDRQKLEEEEASYFFYQLINGLDYIHHKNIVHRDLKPENLLLGKGNILKIVDFGLSNYYEDEKLLSTPCGSPCYASPEMVCGNQYNGLMIDIWSCGIIIFAMTCGYLPFEDTNNELLFKKIMKCKVDYPKFLSDNTLDIMKKILVVDPNKRITIEQIRKHPFYLRGKNIFEFKNKNLVCQVEKIIDENIRENNDNDENDNSKDNKDDKNIKKSKSTNYLGNENIIKNNRKYKIKKFFIDNNINLKEIGNGSNTNREDSSKKNINNKSYGLIGKKFHISISSKDKNIIFKEKDKIMSINYELKDTNNNSNYNSNSNKIEESENNLVKKISKDVLGLDDKKHKEIYDTNILSELSSQNFPLSDDLHQKLPEESPNRIEEYQNLGKNKNILNNGKTKINLSLLQQLLKKEKSTKLYKDKNYFILSPKTKKNNDSLSYVLPPTKKKKSDDKINKNLKTEHKNIMKSLNCEKNENNSEQIEENSNPTNRSDKSNNKSILTYNNKHHDNLELIKYGISNKDINNILYKYNKSVKKLYEPITTKNKPITNLENITNKENDTNTNINNTNNYNSGLYNNNMHIKNLRILNNNNYNNIKNITNINNVKSINNIIICNSPLKSLIKDVQLLTKLKTNNNNNNDLPNINLNNNLHKEIKTMNINLNNINNKINFNNANINKNNVTSPSNNNILIPKILMSKDINNLGMYNDNNTTNLNKMYKGSLNKKLNNINKKNSVKNLINNYRNNSSNEYLIKKSLSKNQFSERNFNSYGYDINENENNSINKKSHIIYTTKNKMSLNKIKNKVDPFTYGRNNENLITLKKIKYNNNNNTNFNTEKINTKKILDINSYK